MSAIPGLGLSAQIQETAPEPELREIQLPAGSEWRFEVPNDGRLNVKLVPKPSNSTPQSITNDSDPATGTAEIFGTELAPNRDYEFPALTKAAVFTHHGCTLSISGNCEGDYVAEETPMNEYLNVHFALENLRTTAEEQKTDGPRVLVVGSENAGKTSLLKTLTAYATKSGRTPLMVNLDPHEVMLCLPGGMSTAAMGTGAVLDVEDQASNGWGSSPIGGPSTVPVKMPLVYHYGYPGPEEHLEIYKPITARMALAVSARFNEDPEVKESGILVDIAASACSGKKGTDIIAHVVSEFSINVVLVLGSERLYNDMSRRFTNTHSDDEIIHVLKLTRSGGCVERDQTYMQQLRQAQIRSYFFGTPKNTLSPHTTTVEYGALHIYKVANPSSTNTDFLPGGFDDDSAQRKHGEDAIVERATPSMAMQNALLVIKHANPTDSYETIRDATVMGYLYVSDVEEGAQRLKILSPASGRLPNKAILWSPWDVAAGMGDLFG